MRLTAASEDVLPGDADDPTGELRVVVEPTGEGRDERDASRPRLGEDGPDVDLGTDYGENKGRPLLAVSSVFVRDDGFDDIARPVRAWARG